MKAEQATFCLLERAFCYKLMLNEETFENLARMLNGSLINNSRLFFFNDCRARKKENTRQNKL